METNETRQTDKVTSIFDNELRWWTDVYREDLPRGFFSFEMRQRLEIVSDLLSVQIRSMHNPKVLECGCGPGDILERLAFLPCRLTGIDLNSRYLGIAEEKVPGATLVDGDLEQLPFPDKSFDIVYGVGVLPYLKEDRRAVEEMSRVLRPGGVALISNPNHFTLACLLDPYYIYRSVRNRKEEDQGVRVRRHRLGQMRSLFNAHGMHEIRSYGISFGPLRFWRRELLPLSISIRISERLRGWSDLKGGSALKHVSSHWISVYRKPPSRTLEAGGRKLNS